MTDQDLFAILGQIHDLTHKAVEMMANQTPGVQAKLTIAPVLQEQIDQPVPPKVWKSGWKTIDGLAEISGEPDPVICPTGRCGQITPKDLNGMLVCPACYARIPDA